MGVGHLLLELGFNPQNVNCSPKCESNSEKNVQNNAFWMILASKAMFYDQQSTVQMWKSIKKSFRFSNF